MKCQYCCNTIPSHTNFCAYCGAMLAVDTGEAILPWPEWEWQRIALFTAIPAGLYCFFVGISLIAEGGAVALIIMIPALALVAAACYAGIKSRWLRSIWQAPRGARLAGGISIVWGLLVLASIMLGIIAITLMIILMLEAISLKK